MHQAGDIVENPMTWLAKASSLALGIASATVSLSLTAPLAAQPGVLTAKYADSRINIRSGPSTATAIQCEGVPGDSMDVLAQRFQPDGYRWYYGRIHHCNALGWVRGDLLALKPNTRPAPAAVPTPESVPVAMTDSVTVPTTAIAPTPLPETMSAPSPATPVTPISSDNSLPAYTQAQLDYFLEIAFGAEYGQSDLSIKKWEGPIKIRVLGSPTAQDRAVLHTVVQELKSLLGSVSIDIVQSGDANLTIHFVPEAEFHRHEPAYRPVNLGYFRTWWNQGKIYQARVLISTTGVTPQERAHLIREELTQTLGLMRDSYRYPDSIFFQGWTKTTRYSELDAALVQLLYRPEIRPGMTKAQVLQVINQVRSRQSTASRS